ncbi:MAG: PAC2 family protein, partial [Chloroflexota bacterium]
MGLFQLEEAADLAEPTLIVAFDGWIDAGGAATAAAARLVDDEQIVATFDGDLLFDYRARRPTLEIEDGHLSELTWPALVLRRSTV